MPVSDAGVDDVDAGGAAAAAQLGGNGGGRAGGSGGEGPSAKRFKRGEEDDSIPPSPVLHVRSLPLDVNDYEVRNLMPVPQHVTKVMVLRGKGQAFVQFIDIPHATDALRHFDTHRAVVR